MPLINFKGKSAVWNHHLSVPFHTLEKDEKLSLDGKDASENLIIEGDNLLALKSLLPKYQGKVKCIYIDPPYNTGKEGWIYNDAVNSPSIQEWMGVTVAKDDLSRHEKWLCMMTPRLKLLRELLSDDGVIFISIGDDELHNLICLMNEIFGEDNFVSTYIWQKKKGGSNDSKHTATEHEYVLFYAKYKGNLPPLFLDHDEDYLKRYDQEDEVGKYYWDTFKRKSGKQYYPITLPDGSIIEFDENGNKISWLRSEARFKSDVEKGEIKFKKNGNSWSILFKQREPKGKKPRTLLTDVGTTSDGSEELLEMFGKNVFDNPKPSSLISHLLQIGSTNSDDLILDSYAGSGTTAQAVLDLNDKDDGTRNFILVQMPESSQDEPDKNICRDITRERVVKTIKKNKLEIGFTYQRMGSAIDAENLISGNLPTYQDFAKYVYYLATGKNLDNDKRIDPKKFFVGKSDRESVYLVYEQDLDKLKDLAITLKWAEEVSAKDPGRKIVYAPACYLDEESLDKFDIKFVSIPYNLFERNEQ